MNPSFEPFTIVAGAPDVDLESAALHLNEWNCQPQRLSDAAQLIRAVAYRAPALVVMDEALACQCAVQLKSICPGLPAVVVSDVAAGNLPDVALEYLSRPIDPRRLRVLVAYALERRKLLDRIEVLEASLGASDRSADDQLRPIDRIQKHAIVDALRQADGNVREAARLLGLGQATVYRKIKRYAIAYPGRGKTLKDSTPRDSTTVPHPDPVQFGE
jgi:DNA-binding NtrC family response regulator